METIERAYGGYLNEGFGFNAASVKQYMDNVCVRYAEQTGGYTEPDYQNKTIVFYYDMQEIFHDTVLECIHTADVFAQNKS